MNDEEIAEVDISITSGPNGLPEWIDIHPTFSSCHHAISVLNINISPLRSDDREIHSYVVKRV
jgi:hypothetical protein